MTWHRESRRHALASKGIKTAQKIQRLPKGIKEPIFLISNLNTIDLKRFKKEKPLSYAFFMLGRNLNNSGMRLDFVNQDKNRVYFKIHNKINNYTTSINELSNEELLNMDFYFLTDLKESVWNKAI